MKQQSEPDKHAAPAADDSNLRGFLGARASGPPKQCVAGSWYMYLPRPCQAPACGGKPAPVKDGYRCVGGMYHIVLSTPFRMRASSLRTHRRHAAQEGFIGEHDQKLKTLKNLPRPQGRCGNSVHVSRYVIGLLLRITIHETDYTYNCNAKSRQKCRENTEQDDSR
jgi:hypothetical protein